MCCVSFHLNVNSDLNSVVDRDLQNSVSTAISNCYLVPKMFGLIDYASGIARTINAAAL